MTLRRWIPAGLVALTLGACVGCPADPDPDPAPSSNSRPDPTPKDEAAIRAAAPGEPTPGSEDYAHQLEQLPTVALVVGGVPLTAYVANTEASRRLGLMFVEELPDARGMIFVYPTADRHGFWMHNTYIPLSIAYITEGFVVDEVIDMTPFDETSRQSRGLVRYVLEVNQGWFERQGVPREGAKVEGLGDLMGYE
ncbi:MAG: DUF192 domain-containing protein [Planctomycetes bacterium]|nr:DUF192 domain-containing protein [Planctomycetota bacterium]